MTLVRDPMRGVQLVLPWPPSVNTYWRHVALAGKVGRRPTVRVLVSEDGRKYRSRVLAAVLQFKPRPRFGEDRLHVEIHALPPDRRVRDLDNLLKAPLDALKHAGLYLDDGQIDELRIVRQGVRPGGELVVRLFPLVLAVAA